MDSEADFEIRKKGSEYMNGIYYARCGEQGGPSKKWHIPLRDETIIIDRNSFRKLLPGTEMVAGGKNTKNVRLTFTKNEKFDVNPTNESATRQIDQFSWSWDGYGVTEHWFDSKAICLKSVSSYTSQSGLTADDTRIVAYERHVWVGSYYKGEKPKIDSSICAEFVNYPTNYRANWTGFAISQNFVGELDQVIKAELGEYGEIPVSTCRHNPTMRVKIVSPERKSFYLCRACRLKGIRIEEFTKRNQKDICPYFHRACQSFTEKLDRFPRWFYWRDENLLSCQQRLSEGSNKIYEIVCLRRHDGFIRRIVLLLEECYEEAWIFPYFGFIPNSMEKFNEKYKKKAGRKYDRN